MKATMNQKRIPWAWLAVAGIAYLLLRKPSAPAAQDIGGDIQGLSIDGVPMGAHLVAKNPGQNATVTAAWTGSTLNAGGSGITWFYRVRTWILNSSGQIIAGPSDSGSLSAPFNVPQSTVLTIQVPTNVTPGQFLGVLVHLDALRSDANGLPTATFDNIAAAEHSNAIQVGGAALPGGSVGVIGVSQEPWQ